MITCPNCGQREVNYARICTKCGTALNTEQNELDQVESVAIKPATIKPDALQQPTAERPPQQTDASLSDSTVQPSEQGGQPDERQDSKRGSGLLGCLGKTAAFVAIGIAFLVVSAIITPSQGATMDAGAYVKTVIELGGVAFLVLIIAAIYRGLTK